MTRERFEHIQREFEQAIKCQAAFGGLKLPLLLWGETIKAFDEMWTERDDAIAVKNNLCQQNTELLEDVSALTIKRDEAIMEGMVLAQEKDGLQVEIDRLRAENAEKDQEVTALTAKVEELRERIEDMRCDFE